MRPKGRSVRRGADRQRGTEGKLTCATGSALWLRLSGLFNLPLLCAGFGRTKGAIGVPFCWMSRGAGCPEIGRGRGLR